MNKNILIIVILIVVVGGGFLSYRFWPKENNEFFGWNIYISEEHKLELKHPKSFIVSVNCYEYMPICIDTGTEWSYFFWEMNQKEIDQYIENDDRRKIIKNMIVGDMKIDIYSGDPGTMPIMALIPIDSNNFLVFHVSRGSAIEPFSKKLPGDPLDIFYKIVSSLKFID